MSSRQSESQLDQPVSHGDSQPGTSEDIRDVMNVPGPFAPSMSPENLSATFDGLSFSEPVRQFNDSAGDLHITETGEVGRRSDSPRGLEPIFLGHRKPTEQEPQGIAQRRTELEAAMVSARLEQEEQTEFSEDHEETEGISGPMGPDNRRVIDIPADSSSVLELAGAIPLMTGVAIVDPDVLDKILDGDGEYQHSEILRPKGSVEHLDERALQETHGSAGSEADLSGMEPGHTIDDGLSPSSPSSPTLPGPNLHSISSYVASLEDAEIQTPSASTESVAESSTSKKQAQTPSPVGKDEVRAPSTQAFPDFAEVPQRPLPYALTSESGTPRAKRVSFAEEPTSETPFTGALKHFREYKNNPEKSKKASGKENVTGKSRRNASLPEEIAELAKIVDGDLSNLAEQANRTNNEEENRNLEDLEVYREHDLAPFDPVMENRTAGDIIMPATPPSTSNKKIDIRTFAENQGILSPVLSALNSAKRTPSSSLRKPLTYDLPIPGHFGDTYNLKIETNASENQIADYIRQRGTELEANEGEIDNSVAEFLADPSGFVVGEGKQVGADDGAEQPVFIRVIELIPMAIFWAIAGNVARVANWGFDSLVSKLTGLDLGDGEEKEDVGEHERMKTEQK